MRIANRVPATTPPGENALPEEKSRTSEGLAPDTGFRDTVQISSAARRLQSDRAQRKDQSQAVNHSDGSHLERIRQRIETGFYDSKEARLAVAEGILMLFGR